MGLAFLPAAPAPRSRQGPCGPPELALGSCPHVVPSPRKPARGGVGELPCCAVLLCSGVPPLSPAGVSSAADFTDSSSVTRAWCGLWTRFQGAGLPRSVADAHRSGRSAAFPQPLTPCSQGESQKQKRDPGQGAG